MFKFVMFARSCFSGIGSVVCISLALMGGSVSGAPKDDKKPDSGGGDKCLACQISKISECAASVCPSAKKNSGSCSPEIKSCVKTSCSGSCEGVLSAPVRDRNDRAISDQIKQLKF